jgi:hypothetical protein
VLRGRRAIGRRARIAGDRGGRLGFLAIDPTADFYRNVSQRMLCLRMILSDLPSPAEAPNRKTSAIGTSRRRKTGNPLFGIMR